MCTFEEVRGQVASSGRITMQCIFLPNMNVIFWWSWGVLCSPKWWHFFEIQPGIILQHMPHKFVRPKCDPSYESCREFIALWISVFFVWFVLVIHCFTWASKFLVLLGDPHTALFPQIHTSLILEPNWGIKGLVARGAHLLLMPLLEEFMCVTAETPLVFIFHFYSLATWTCETPGSGIFDLDSERQSVVSCVVKKKIKDTQSAFERTRVRFARKDAVR
jgi:hypothetical protein